MMSPTPQVRIGVIGLGVMGTGHAQVLLEGRVPRARLTAVSDTDPHRLTAYPDLPGYTDPADLIRSGAVDAVIIATPHYAHTTIGIAALVAGLHVLVEKPISVHKADAQRLVAAHRGSNQVFAAMFNLRFTPSYQRIRELLRDGTLGPIRRWSWIATSWFRPLCYFASGSWRATWAGEGGGLLLNQCPHNLDMIGWLFGPPRRVRAVCHRGKYHPIEVEDEVTAYLEYANGSTGVFIASTGEAPGADRLEIAGENGKLLYEDKTLRLWRNEVPTAEYSRTTTDRFSLPPCQVETISVTAHTADHAVILQNVVDAILGGAPLVAPAHEGIASVELANAMLFSSWHERTVDLPLDAVAYERLLQRWIREAAQPGPAHALAAAVRPLGGRGARRAGSRKRRGRAPL